MTTKKKLLILSRYDVNGASSRLRSFQYIPFFSDNGYEVTVSPLFDAKYLELLYNYNKRSLKTVCYSYARRFFRLLRLNEFDLLWIEKETLPLLPAFFENILISSKIPYIVDYDDAIFHNYDLHSVSFIRKLLANKLDSLLSNSHCVLVGNSYLYDYVKKHGAKRIAYVPTVIDINKYSYSSIPKNTKEYRIGWIGSPSTSKYLQPMMKIFGELPKELNVRFVTIGAPHLNNCPVPLEQHQWSEENEADLLSSIDVGIMPLPDEPWERGKCGYKLIQYMACARPVVGSPVGVNKDIITADVGFLAENDADWGKHLEALGRDVSLRIRMGTNARRKVEDIYNSSVTAPEILKILNSISVLKIRKNCI
ncbi:glycosyltransferase family 4 protein [Pectobacterium polaris]|uniref:glycosyltransferase family 4 protein n=1 Tax=Pectobacterium polaris TaxID=2042057 RepID=UPI0015828DE7|nr:glycosyltransferase family 4 protein [Pectobacterium polaris]